MGKITAIIIAIVVVGLMGTYDLQGHQADVSAHHAAEMMDDFTNLQDAIDSHP